MGKRRDWSWLNEDTARDYYLENYEGMSRGEVKEEDGALCTIPVLLALCSPDILVPDLIIELDP